jgi:hypothetical protein
MWFVKKFIIVLKDFNVNGSIVKIHKTYDELKFYIWKKIILEKFQGILQLNYSFYGGLFFSLNLDITMNFFESTFFIFCVWQT